MEAARVLALKGHKPVIFEKGIALGGQLGIASVPPRKHEMNRILPYFEHTLAQLGVEIRLNCPFDKSMAGDFDKVIVAVGAHNAEIHFPGYDLPNVVSSWDVLGERALVSGKVVVCGGGLVGVETAEKPCEEGYDVGFVEMQEKIAKEESATILPTILKSFEEHGVKVHTLSRIKAFEKDGVLVDLLDKDGNVTGETKVCGDTIVTALTSTKNVFDAEGIEEKVLYVGDCLIGAPCSIENAIKTAYDAANSLN